MKKEIPDTNADRFGSILRTEFVNSVNEADGNKVNDIWSKVY